MSTELERARHETWHDRDYARRFVFGELPIPYLKMEEFVEAAVSVAILYAEHVEHLVREETIEACAQICDRKNLHYMAKDIRSLALPPAQELAKEGNN